MSKAPFEKFIKSEAKGAKKKEAIKQEKRKMKAEARALGEQKRKEKWEKQRGIVNNEEKETRGRKQKPAISSQKSAGSHQPSGARTRKPVANNPKSEKDNKKAFEAEKADLRSWADSYTKGETPKTPRAPKPETSNRKPVTGNQKPATGNQQPASDKPYSKKYIRSNSDKYFKDKEKPRAPKSEEAVQSEQMPLNKFIAHAGVCGRREAAEMVKQGIVSVNGDIVYEPGYKVAATDDVRVKGKKLFTQKNLVYILLNKPKDFITTANDPQGRKTVLDLIKGATPERVYPVGRLDRNTTGVLLLTNDGELAQKLTHPSYQVKKIYEAKLDKPLVKKDFEAILNGVTLEDGFVAADNLAYADANDKSVIGIEIHSGRNRVVRRIFEHLGYDVKGLDRVMFANLTKKNVDRSKWRMLSEKEVRLLKYMNQSFAKNKNAKGQKEADHND